MKYPAGILGLFLLLLCGCEQSSTQEVDLSKYFLGLNGTAVFYNPTTQDYKIYNPQLSEVQSSPCSTFKVISSYISLAENVVSLGNSQREWNKTIYWHPQWNQNMVLEQAFKVSCVWYYRQLIDEVGAEKMSAYLDKLNYGNQDISDWNGSLNTNSNDRNLKGFWIESSLKISPKEQTQVLSKLLSENTQAVQDLKKIMLAAETPVKIYGKTGMGVKDDKISNAWFVGFYEKDNRQIFFAVRLTEPENNQLEDYRNKASLYAKQIATDIINNEKLF